jgi:hypothetical protein
MMQRQMGIRNWEWVAFFIFPFVFLKHSVACGYRLQKECILGVSVLRWGEVRGRHSETRMQRDMGTVDKGKDAGERVIAPTRRPDGSLRKEIRIRAGYTPQDEVAIYQSKAALVWIFSPPFFLVSINLQPMCPFSSCTCFRNLDCDATSVSLKFFCSYTGI